VAQLAVFGFCPITEPRTTACSHTGSKTTGSLGAVWWQPGTLANHGFSREVEKTRFFHLRRPLIRSAPAKVSSQSPDVHFCTVHKISSDTCVKYWSETETMKVSRLPAALA
jgi:hypothetical protein